MADVFISYHMESAGKIVRQIANALEDVGVSCWYAERDLRDPDAFVSTITKEIRACKVFLLILNEGSNQSEHVKNELNFAFERKNRKESIKFVSFRVDNCVFSDDISYYIGRFQITDGNPPDQKHIQALTEQIADIFRGRPTWKMIQERNNRITELKNEQKQVKELARKQAQELHTQMEKLQSLQKQAQMLEQQLKQGKNRIQELELIPEMEWKRELEKEMELKEALIIFLCILLFSFICFCSFITVFLYVVLQKWILALVPWYS